MNVKLPSGDVKLPSGDLTLGPCPSHPTNIYTCIVTTQFDVQLLELNSIADLSIGELFCLFSPL